MIKLLRSRVVAHCDHNDAGSFRTVCTKQSGEEPISLRLGLS